MPGLPAWLGTAQAAALSGSVLASWAGLDPVQRRLLVACGAGAGMGAVYNVPLGGALITAELLMAQLNRLVDAGNTVIVVEHAMDVVAAADWVMDLGPAGGDAGGRIVAAGHPAAVARSRGSRTAPYLAAALRASSPGKEQ